MQGGQTRSRDFLEGLSFVLASRQRETVLAAVIPGPKTPMQVAKQTGLHLPHVSRALGQLVRTDLVERVAGQRRGRLYAASGLGRAVFGELAEERGDRIVAPMIRGGHLRNPPYVDGRGRDPDWRRPRSVHFASGRLVSPPGGLASPRCDRSAFRRRHLRDDSTHAPRGGEELFVGQAPHLKGDSLHALARVVPECVLAGVQPRTPRGRGPGASRPAQELRLDQQPRPLRGVVGRVRGVRPDAEDRGHRDEGRVHAPRRPVLRLPAGLVILAPRNARTERNKAW